MADMNDDDLLDALGIELAPATVTGRSPREERIIAGFEDILRFYRMTGRAPQSDEDRDIFERLYAIRLDRLRKLPEAKSLLGEMDVYALLEVDASTLIDVDELDEDALLAGLGLVDEPLDPGSIAVLRNVRPYAEIKAAEEIANRTPCVDFAGFQALFSEAEAGLKSSAWMTKPFVKNASIQVGDFFIVGGQIAYVAEMSDGTMTKDGRDNPRLRVIFDNHTEGNLLLRSLSRSLYPDGDAPMGLRLIKKNDGPLFAGTIEPDDIESGTVYVLRSLSDNPYVAQHRELIHKIGVTGGSVETRIAGCKKDATFLFADVDIVATYKLHNLSRMKLEKIFHRLFGAVQLDLVIDDRFGNPIKPREWFLVPLHVIDETVQRILDGSIIDTEYDPNMARLIIRASA